MKIIFTLQSQRFQKLKFMDFRDPLPPNSKTSKTLLDFLKLSRSWKKISKTFKDLWPLC